MKHGSRSARAGHILHGANDFQAREILSQVAGCEAVANAYARGHNPVFELLERVVAQLGGNYSATPTRVRAGTLERLRVETARTRAERLQRNLMTTPLDEVLSQFTPPDTFGDCIPFLRTYRAEMLLWVGRYEEALEEFCQVWHASRTRWGYVGRGAALARLGRHQEALAAWDEGGQYFGRLPQEATHAYQGEVMFALGRLEAALECLRHATHATPTRLGAHLALAVVEHDAGNLVRSRQALDAATQLAPALIVSSMRYLQMPTPPTADSDVRRLAKRSLESLRGNRSSSLFTFFGEDGAMSVIRLAPRGRWASVAEQLRGCGEDLRIEPLRPWLESTRSDA
ncbi:MAG: tetratricopeptide repeat protein [Myxococcales bacterium]|nr:tetratricopeptide repeat protein [Myxococcales bacterium]